MDARLSNIFSLCCSSDRGRGIWKRIDENRECLEVVHREILVRGCPSGPPYESWMGNNDIFFANIINALELNKPKWLGEFFPRLWPGIFPVEESYRTFTYTMLNHEVERNTLHYSNVISVCTECDAGRGIWKRIDENRELLQFFYREWHQILLNNPSVEIWIENQDMFLNNIARALALVKPAWMVGRFPRLWPGVIGIERYYNDYPPFIPA